MGETPQISHANQRYPNTEILLSYSAFLAQRRSRTTKTLLVPRNVSVSVVPSAQAEEERTTCLSSSEEDRDALLDA